MLFFLLFLWKVLRLFVKEESEKRILYVDTDNFYFIFLKCEVHFQ